MHAHTLWYSIPNTSLKNGSNNALKTNTFNSHSTKKGWRTWLYACMDANTPYKNVL